MRHPMCACEAYYDEHHPECPVRQHIEALRSETARLRALLDERTALLRECEAEFDRVWTKQAQDLSRRIRAALETTCDS